MIARERICVTADRSRVVPASSGHAAFLLAGEGSEIEPEDAERYGIVDGLMPQRGAGSPTPEPAAKVTGSRSGSRSGRKGEDKALRPRGGAVEDK